MHKEFTGKGKNIWEDSETYEDLSNYLRNWINEPVERSGFSVRGRNGSLEVEVSLHPTLGARLKGKGNTIMRVKITPNQTDNFGESAEGQLLSYLARFEPRYLRHGWANKDESEERNYSFRSLDPLRHIA